MFLKTCKMWSKGIKLFFSKKLRKIAQRLGASLPDHHSFRRLGAKHSDSCLWYVWITVTSLLKRVSQLRHFRILTIDLSSFLERVPSYVPTPGHGFWSSILRYLCPPQKIPLSKFLMTSLHEIWGLISPPIKNPGYAYDSGSRFTTFFFFNCFQQLAVISFWLTYAVYHPLSSIKHSNIIVKHLRKHIL